MRNSMKNTGHAVVIGAGVAGLATATLLARDGWTVEVIEKNAQVGGRAGSLQLDDFPGFRWDTGPSWYLMPEAFDHFFDLCGTSTEEELDLVDLNPGYRVYSGDRGPVDVPSGRTAVAELFESIEAGAGAALEDYLDSASDTYAVSIDRFLYNNFLRLGPILHRDVLTRAGLLARLLSTSLEAYVDARFADPLLRHILCYPAVFLSSSPSTTPAMYHLMSHTDLVEGVRYPMGGFAAVIDALTRLAVRNGVTFRLSTTVVSIASEGGQATGVTVEDAGTHVRIDANLVVSAADLHHTENHLLPAQLRTYPEHYWAKKNPGIGCVLVMLGVKGQLPQLLHHTLVLSEQWDEDFEVVFNGPQPERPENASRSIYVSMPSATDPGVAPEGYENLFVLVPTAAAPHLGTGNAYATEESPTVHAIAEHVIEQIAQQVGIPDLTERIVVSRTVGPGDFEQLYHSWRGGALGPAHILRQSAFLRGSNKSKKLDGLYYAGATTVPGVGVPMCLISAENVLKRLRADTSPGPISGECS